MPKQAPGVSQYLLRIVRVDGQPVHLRPGCDAELDLIQSVIDAAATDDFIAKLADAAVAKGVGVFRTEAQVRAAVVETLRETLPTHIGHTLADVLYDLKADVMP